MDLTVYYEKIRDTKDNIFEDFPVVVSLPTSDGGKSGVCSEVSRAVAAKMLVDGLARPASREEELLFRETQASAKKAADDLAAAARVTFTVMSQPAPAEKA
jgi:hypothetical protein